MRKIRSKRQLYIMKKSQHIIYIVSHIVVSNNWRHACKLASCRGNMTLCNDHWNAEKRKETKRDKKSTYVYACPVYVVR